MRPTATDAQQWRGQFNHAAYCHLRAAVAWSVHPRVLLLLGLWSKYRVANVQVLPCFSIVSFFFDDFCQPLNLGFHWTDFHAVSPFGSAMAVDDQSEPRFLIFQGTLPWQPTFVFRSFIFFRRNSKTTRDTHMVPGKENVGNFVFCRMAPSAMTSGDPECQHCFRFVLLLAVRFAQKLRDRSSPFFSPAGSPTGVEDCCKIGLLFVKRRCHGNEFLSFSDIFRPNLSLLCYAQFPFVRFVVQ